jgi:glycosyltransferase involved in cell wall biosynthesis
MKVWLIHHYAIPPIEAGITRHYQLARELQKLGHEPVIIAADKHHRTNGAHALPATTSAGLDVSNDVPVLRLRTLSLSAQIPKRVANMLAFGYRLFRRSGLDKLEKPDLIIGCTPDLFSALMSCRLAKKIGVPFLFHVGEIWPLMLTEVGNAHKWHPFILLLGWIEKYLYRNADAILAAQPLTSQHVQEQGGSKGKIFFIPNGVDLSQLPATVTAPPNEIFTVMYIGAMGLANGMFEILDAAKILKGRKVEFQMIGDGPLRHALMEKARTENIDNIVFRAAVPKTEIYAAMQNADAYIVNIPDKKPYRYGLAHN